MHRSVPAARACRGAVRREAVKGGRSKGREQRERTKKRIRTRIKSAGRIKKG